ncbi:hypothetical protein K5D48_25350, partial [Pseudomonas cichorii]|nr:hypothetical protein [Pseudomonas cichorii]
APWAVIREAKPVLIDGKSVGILDRSSAYWKAQGNKVWGDAIRGFRVTVVAMGAFAVVAAVLELVDLYADHDSAKTSEEKAAILIKAIAVISIGIGGALHVWAALKVSGGLTFFVMSPWFVVGAFVVGAIYLLACLALNYFKSDNVGWWLKKCCWTRSIELRHADTPEGRSEEKRSLLEVQLSPQVFVKSTVVYESRYLGKGDYMEVAVPNGAWIQIRLPNVVRGKWIRLNVIGSKRPLGVLPVAKIESSIKDIFEARGQYTHIRKFAKVSNERPPHPSSELHFPIMPEDEDVVWQTWVPLDKSTDYIELQIWYPGDVVSHGKEGRGYLYQIEPDKKGNGTADGLTLTKLLVSAEPRAQSLILPTPE